MRIGRERKMEEEDDLEILYGRYPEGTSRRRWRNPPLHRRLHFPIATVIATFHLKNDKKKKNS